MKSGALVIVGLAAFAGGIELVINDSYILELIYKEELIIVIGTMLLATGLLYLIEGVRRGALYASNLDRNARWPVSKGETKKRPHDFDEIRARMGMIDAGKSAASARQHLTAVSSIAEWLEQEGDGRIEISSGRPVKVQTRPLRYG